LEADAGSWIYEQSLLLTIVAFFCPSKDTQALLLASSGI
jgi:hypothetical protein